MGILAHAGLLMEGGTPPPADISNLTFIGANGSTDWDDATGKTWTANGNAQIQSNRLLLDGTGDYIESTHAEFALGTGDFTIKMIDVRWVAAGNRGLFSTSLSSSPGQLAVAYDGSQIQLNWNGNETDDPFTPTLGNSYDIWVVRSGTSLKLYLGATGGSLTQRISVTDSSNKSNTTFYLGAYWNSSFTFSGSYGQFVTLAYAETPP